MNPTQSAPGAKAMVERLAMLAAREDRGALAALRRGLGKEPGTAAEMYPLVEWAFEGEGPDAAYIVASLFGMLPNHREGTGYRSERGLGATLRAIRFREDSTEEDDGVTRRFTALLDCDGEALSIHLRHLVALLKSRKPDTTIDFLRLYWDVTHWDEPDREVQKSWAAGFWGYRKATTDNIDDPAHAGAETDDAQDTTQE